MNTIDRETLLGRFVHWTLLSGVALSGMLLALGLLTMFAHHEIRPEGPPPTLGVLARGALAGNGVSITCLALLVLMVTPVVRVAVLAAGWALTGARRYAVVAAAVLCLLGFSMIAGIR
jgi:uncharacterized membrane protein